VKKAIGIGSAALVLLFMAAPQTQAAPLDLKEVAAKSQWVGHLDVDAMRQSSVVRRAYEKVKERHKDVDTHLSLASNFIGIDLRTDLQGLTFYGPHLHQHKGVMIVHGKFDADRLAALEKVAPAHEHTKYGDYEIHSGEAKHHHHTHPVAATFVKPDRIVFASGVDDLKAALDVLNGKSPSLTSDSALAGNIPEGTIALFRAKDLGQDGCCNFAKRLDSFRFVVGEHNGESFKRVRLVAKDEEVPKELAKAAEGLDALLRLHCGDNKVGKKLINATRINAEGKSLTILWKAPADDVWQMVELHAKIFAEKWAKHHGKKKGEKGEQKPRQEQKKKGPSAEENF
jgi:hypothetical protein